MAISGPQRPGLLACGKNIEWGRRRNAVRQKWVKEGRGVTPRKHGHLPRSDIRDHDIHVFIIYMLYILL